jgi:hypothetical protein
MHGDSGTENLPQAILEFSDFVGGQLARLKVAGWPLLLDSARALREEVTTHPRGKRGEAVT